MAALGGPNIKAVLLGKTPRYAPDRAADTLHLALDLKIDFARKSVSGTCLTRLRAFRDGVREAAFDAVDLDVASVTVDDKPARYTLRDKKLRVRLPRTLASGEEAAVLVRYSLKDPKAGLHFVYPGKHNPENPVQVWSQSQPEDARCWFPCHDSPHQKTTSEARLTVPKGFTAVSNGALIETAHQGAWSTYHWNMRQPHSIYLISVAAGRFAEIAEDWEGIPVTYYCEKGREADARRGFGKTVKAIDFFSKMTGVRYPYEKYAQVAVAEYPGGMEHTTCTTQTDACLIDKRAFLDSDLDLLVAHELAHQWFGDLVTCRDWSHAWLNEGFATYFEVLFQAHDKGQDEADYELSVNARAYFDEDARRYRRPIVCNTFKFPWILFDRHLYEKGGWVLHMLRHELGDDLWWRAIKHYLTRFRDKSVETTDLIDCIQEATGLNPRPFFDQWVYKSGYPVLRANYSWDPASKKAGLWVLQTQDATDDSPLFRFPVEIRATGRGWERTFKEKITGREHRFSWALPGEPVDIEFDPEHRILKKLTLTKPLAMWRRQLRSSRSGLSRLEAASHVARWGDTKAVALLERQARVERFWAAGAEFIRALGVIGTDASFASVKRLLSVKHPKLRRAAVEALARFSRPEAAALAAAYARRDPSIHVEAAAHRTLGQKRDPRYKGLLLSGLKKRSYRQVISAGALEGLAATKDPGLLDTFRKASLPPNRFGTRLQAMRALADYAPLSEKVVPWLCESAHDPDERVNLMAVAILGHLEDERALATLKDMAKNAANTRLRTYAEEAIAHIRAGVEEKK